MNNNVLKLKENLLFKDISESEIEQILNVVPNSQKNYFDGEIIVHQGDIINNIGIVVEGNAVGKKYTFDGEEIIVSHFGENRIFADVLSGADGYASPVTIQAIKGCTILFIDYHKLIFSQYPSTQRVLRNMIQNISLKFFYQNKRMDILMIKSVRGKVLAYLEWQKEINNSNKFRISLDRRLMADFLGVERSALSRELSRMKKERIIEYHKNEFILLNFD